MLVLTQLSFYIVTYDQKIQSTYDIRITERRQAATDLEKFQTQNFNVQITEIAQVLKHQDKFHLTWLLSV